MSNSNSELIVMKNINKSDNNTLHTFTVHQCRLNEWPTSDVTM